MDTLIEFNVITSMNCLGLFNGKAILVDDPEEGGYCLCVRTSNIPKESEDIKIHIGDRIKLNPDGKFEIYRRIFKGRI